MEKKRFLLVFLLDGQRYALDIAGVRRVIRVVAVTPLPKAPPIVMGVINFGGEVIPVIKLRERFNHPPGEMRLTDHFIIATAGKRTVALLADETIGVIAGLSGDYAPADGILPGLELVEGAVKLDDGLILIHDLQRLLSLEEETAIDAALTAFPGPVSQGNDEPAR